MLRNRIFQPSRAGPESTFAALWSEAPCRLEAPEPGEPVGDPRVVERLFRKLRDGNQAVRSKKTSRNRQPLRRPHLEEES